MEITRPVTPIIVIIVSLALLIPGVTQPMLTLTGTIEKSQITETGIDLIVDSIVEKELKKDKNKSEEDIRKKAGRMVGMVTGVLGLKDITGEVEAYKKTRSIAGTVKELFRSGNIIVAFLVMLFSIIIPGTKILLLLLGTYFQELKISRKSLSINNVISKWSMADVFVIAIIVAYMAASASTMGGLINFHGHFEPGFYSFLGYCIFSILSTQLITKKYMTVKS